MSDFDKLFTVCCGNCDAVAPLEAWCNTKTGPLPCGEFQCPACHYSFKRQRKQPRKSWEKFVELVPIQSRL